MMSGRQLVRLLKCHLALPETCTQDLLALDSLCVSVTYGNMIVHDFVNLFYYTANILLSIPGTRLLVDTVEPVLSGHSKIDKTKILMSHEMVA